MKMLCKVESVKYIYYGTSCIYNPIIHASSAMYISFLGKVENVHSDVTSLLLLVYKKFIVQINTNFTHELNMMLKQYSVK